MIMTIAETIVMNLNTAKVSLVVIAYISDLQIKVYNSSVDKYISRSKHDSQILQSALETNLHAAINFVFHCQISVTARMIVGITAMKLSPVQVTIQCIVKL